MWQADPEKSPKDSARPKGTHWFHGQSADGAECVHEAAAIPWLACRSGFPRVTWDWGAVVAKETRCILWCQTWLAGKSPKNQGFRGKSSNEMVGFPSPLFVYSRLPPPAPPAACLTHNLLTHTTCPHTTYSHTQLTNTQLVHTQLTHTHNLSSHNLSTQNLSTHNLLSHNLSTHNLSTHSLLSHNLSTHNLLTHAHTTSSHTQLIHTHNLLTHNLSSHNLSTHNLSTHNLLTHNLLTHNLATWTFTLRGRSGTCGTGLALVARLVPVDAVVAAAVCVAGVALGDIDVHLAWQAWHLATSSSTLRGRRGTWRHRPSLCGAGVALGDINFDFAWQAWHLATSTSTLRGRRGTWRHRPAFCVAAVVLGDIDLHFAWQVWCLWH